MAFLKNYSEYQLDNGLVVALQKMPTHKVIAELKVKFGAVHERKGEEGLAHFLEHCLITAGSEKYSSKKTEEFIGRLAHYGASSDIEETKFVSAMLPEDIGQWLDFMSDGVFNPRFDLRRVEGERQRVLRELADLKSDLSFEVDKMFRRAFYRGHLINTHVLKKEAEKVVSKVEVDELRRIHSRGYCPNNMDLILVGALPRNIKNLVKKHFGKQKPGKSTKVKFPPLKPLRKKTVIHTYAPELYNQENPQESSASIDLAFVVVPETHPDSTALSIISDILGENSVTSRFFKTLGLKEGLTYYIESSYDSSYNAGSFEISAKVPARRLEESIDCIFEEIKKLREKGITKQELERCRRQAKYELADIFDSPGGYVLTIEKRLDNGWTPESFISDFNTITLKRIRQVANKYLPKDRKSGKYVLNIKDPLKQPGTKVL